MTDAPVYQGPEPETEQADTATRLVVSDLRRLADALAETSPVTRKLLLNAGMLVHDPVERLQGRVADVLDDLAPLVVVEPPAEDAYALDAIPPADDTAVLPAVDLAADADREREDAANQAEHQRTQVMEALPWEADPEPAPEPDA